MQAKRGVGARAATAVAISAAASAALGLAALVTPLVLRATACAGQAGGALPPCVPDGECRYYCVDRPALGEPGDPVGASWWKGTGRPRAYESDPFFDDRIGPCSGADPACLEICNLAGELYGAPGVRLNPPGEGDCAEVKFCWTYTYTETVVTGHSVGGSIGASGANGSGGSGGGAVNLGTTSSVARQIIKVGTKCSGEFEVCPC